MSVLEVEGQSAERSKIWPSRRRWSEEDKRRIVEETFEPGASVSIVARRHDLNANMLFTWRRQCRKTAGQMIAPVAFVPARIEAESAVAPPPAGPAGRMEIVLPRGERLIVEADVDASALARVIKVLSRR
jgi:transposase